MIWLYAGMALGAVLVPFVEILSGLSAWSAAIPVVLVAGVSALFCRVETKPRSFVNVIGAPVGTKVEEAFNPEGHRTTTITIPPRPAPTPSRGGRSLNVVIDEKVAANFSSASRRS